MSAHRDIEDPDAARVALTEGEKVVLRAINNLNVAQDRKHIENKAELETLSRQMAEVIAGFPGGDPEGHRRFHDALIAESHARATFWRDMRGRLIEKGIWAVIATICTALWFYFKEGK